MNFQHPLHLASGSLEYTETETYCPSDTLFSAVLACSFQLYGEDFDAEAMLKGVRVSSAFPYAKFGDHVEHFFPKPFSRLPLHPESNKQEEAKISKRLKKIQFLGQSYFEGCLGAILSESIPDTHFLQKGKFLSSKLSNDSVVDTIILKEDHQQRVRVPDQFQREQEAPANSEPFLQKRQYFAENAGLFFFVDFDDEDQKTPFYAALRLLADNGLGTDRNVGNGQFEWEAANLELQLPENATYQLAMGLFCPTKDDLTDTIQLDNSFYELRRRGGWISSSHNSEHLQLRKRSAYMFSEGSIFSLQEAGVQPKGNHLDLRPKWDNPIHPIWRSGRPIFLPFVPHKKNGAA